MMMLMAVLLSMQGVLMVVMVVVLVLFVVDVCMGVRMVMLVAVAFAENVTGTCDQLDMIV